MFHLIPHGLWPAMAGTSETVNTPNGATTIIIIVHNSCCQIFQYFSDGGLLEHRVASALVQQTRHPMSDMLSVAPVAN